MPIIKIEDIAHVRFAAPDLAEMRAFLEDFGLTCVSDDGVLYMRACGTAPFVHATEQGEAGFAAIGFRAESVGDLQVLAAAEGVDVEDLEAPGGGSIVRLRDLDDRPVEVVAGQDMAKPLPLTTRAAVNAVAARNRLRETVRLSAGPAKVVRLGHCVLNVADFRASEAWYKERFGFITSDEIALTPEFSVGAFMRCDRGDQPTDHHTLFLVQAPTGPGFNHAAFEVADFDELMLGHSHLKATDRTAEWGVGRHVLGSQIFDYWRDPWGHTLEHWTDGDLFVADDGSNTATLQDLTNTQWGPSIPDTFA